jgi:TolA-binding protein
MTLIELRKLAEAAKGWLIHPAIVQETEDDTLKLGHAGEDGEFYELIEIDCENYDQPSRPLAEFIAAANPAAVTTLLDQIDALQSKLDTVIQSSAHWQHQFIEVQAENERLCSGLSECRDAFPIPERGSEIERDWMAAMGEPEAVSDYVKAAANALAAKLVTAEADAERYRWLTSLKNGGVFHPAFAMCGNGWREKCGYDAAIDAAKGGQQ